MKYNISRYSSAHTLEWNQLVSESKNGLFFFNRSFMNYHSDRFIDHSLLIYKEEKLVAVLPANEIDNIIYSHQGLTFGSLVFSSKLRTSNVLDIFDEILKYYKKNNFIKLIYKTIPYIFSSYPSQEDLYCLFRNNAKLIRRDVSSVIEIENRLSFSSSKKNQVNKLIKNGLIVKENNDYNTFWNLLISVLARHNVKPVHSLEEINLLHKSFPNNIKLYTVENDTEILAGIVIFIFGNTVHTQYMANSEEGRKKGVLSLINFQLLNEFYSNYKYYSFGISTEQNGFFLNEGLIQQKEEMGARAVTLDFYEISF